GLWNDDTFGSFVVDAAVRNPDQELRMWSDAHPYRGTFADIDARGRQLAGGLAALGVRPGDVVSYQMPNRVEPIVTFWALSLLGAVAVPIVHFYGPNEIAFIANEARPRVHLTDSAWGHLDYVAGFESIAPPSVEHVVVIGDGPRPDGWHRFDD